VLSKTGQDNILPLHKKVNMKIISKIVAISLVAFTLTGCFKKQEQTANQQSGGIQNIFGGNKGMKCVYEMNGQTVTTYVKGDKVRTEGVQTEGNSVDGMMISDGEWMYTWDSVSKKGTKMNIKQIEEMAGDDMTKEVESDEIPEDMQVEIEKMEDEFAAKCSNEKINDSMFVPPTDVEFTDMTQGIDEMNKLQEKWEGKTDFDEADMDELNKAMEKMEGVMGE
jgi:hypothetical protein